MNNLLEIQKEVRRVSDQMTALTASIQKIETEISQLQKNESVQVDFDKISLLAKRFPFGTHPISAFEPKAKTLYLKVLVSIIRLKYWQSGRVDRLIFLQWICTQASYDLQKLLRDTNGISMRMFAEIDRTLPQKAQQQLIVDSLILANFTGQADEDVLAYIANLSIILGVEQKTLRNFSLIAKYVLQQRLEVIRKRDEELLAPYHDLFKHYQHKNQRYLAVKVNDGNVNNFRWMVKQHTFVKKDDVIAIYRRKQYVRNTIVRAASEGILFQFSHAGTIYGVISHPTDSKDAIKAWVLRKENK